MDRKLSYPMFRHHRKPLVLLIFVCASVLIAFALWNYFSGAQRRAAELARKQQADALLKPDDRVVAKPATKADISAQFKELATLGTSGQRRDELVTELSARSFAEVGVQAAQVVSTREIMLHYGYWPEGKRWAPWLEENCPEEDKISYAASVIWNAVVERAERGSISESLGELCLEDRPEAERMMYLNALLSGHYHERVKETLERIARDKAESPEIAVKAATILVQQGDANEYLPLLMAACDRVQNVEKRSSLFNFATSPVARKLTTDNRNLLVNYGFNLLSQLDDGKSGNGHDLAGYLDFVIRDKTDLKSRFAPDQRLPQYQDEHGLNESFFQDKVNNALHWWRENQTDYKPIDSP